MDKANEQWSKLVEIEDHFEGLPAHNREYAEAENDAAALTAIGKGWALVAGYAKAKQTEAEEAAKNAAG